MRRTMKNLLLSIFIIVSFAAVSVAKETTTEKYYRQLQKNKLVKEGVFWGKVALKPHAGKRKSGNLKGARVVIRDRESKRIIAKTTTDGSGNFIFKNMTLRQGLELGWTLPQEVGEPIGEDGCYQLLPYDYTTLEPIEECDDSVLVLRVGLSNCSASPCPWEIKDSETNGVQRE